MNQITQNERLKELRKCGLISSPMLHYALHSPVFVYNLPETVELTADEKDFISENLLSHQYVLRNAPYRCLRIVPNLDYWMQVWFAKDGHPMVLVNANKDIEKGWKASVLWEPRRRYQSDAKPGTWVWEFDISAAKGGEVASNQDLKALIDDRDTFRDKCVDAPFLVMLLLCFELASHRSTVVRVHPNKPGKSVEWTMSRTHYLVLHRSVAKSMSKHRQGMSDRDIERAAHWRRAHFRRLMSDKFKQKKGAIIPVKQAWVGPTEWIGLDKKVYKVIN